MPFFRNEKVNLHYYEYGEGPDIMFAFHGFGMRGTQFEVLISALKEKYTIYSFDLFFHGKTELYDASVEVVRKGLLANEFGGWVQEFIDVIEARGKKISLLSYSMGSLMAWSIIASMPQKVDTAFFIAPDGIKPNKLLKIGSQNSLVNRFFHKMVYSPKTVMFILKRLHQFNYIDESLYRILSQEFASTATRLTCYNAITYHSKLDFNQDELASLLNEYPIRTFFFFGKHDKLFPASIGYEFSKKLNNTHLHVFNDGHELVNEQLRNLLKKQLTNDIKRQT